MHMTSDDQPITKFKDASSHYVIGHPKLLTSKQVHNGFHLISRQTKIVTPVVDEAQNAVQWALIFFELFWKSNN